MMFLSANTCEGIGECIKKCPTKAIRLIGGKAFSCLTCGTCYKTCPNHAIFKNSYGGYIVDKAKCNACGMCMHNCPINSISIEDGIVQGICSRCGNCVEVCPSHSRVDGFELTDAKQKQFIQALNVTLPSYDAPKKSKTKEVTRAYFGTDIDKCILCGRCESYCPTGAIDVTIDRDAGICTECRLCEDVCTNGSINKQLIVNSQTCTLCLNCFRTCPNDAISVKDFKISINKLNHKPSGNIISCLNCGLCAEINDNGSMKFEDSKLRYDPSQDNEGDVIANHQLTIESCPVSSLYESDDLLVFNNSGEELPTLQGFCVSCGTCAKVCDVQNARTYKVASWDGSISDECISCGTCSDVCPKDAITVYRGKVSVNLDDCILCENCAVHCPKDAIPKSTMAKKVVDTGFNCIDQRMCIGCGLCYKTCSYDAIKEIDGRFEVDDEKCTYCGACKTACPANALLFERKFKDLSEGI